MHSNAFESKWFTLHFLLSVILLQPSNYVTFYNHIMTHLQNHWVKLSNPPFGSISCDINYDTVSRSLILNEAELLVIVEDSDCKLKELWIYNIHNDNYTKLMDEKKYK
eukprot:71323_1